MKAFGSAVALCIVVALTAADARAATLVETLIGGESVWVIDDQQSRRVLLASAAGSRLIDLESRTVYLIAPDGRAQSIDAALLPAPVAAPDFTVEKIGPGPRIADYPTTRFRLSADGETCSVIDANLGLADSLVLAMRAFDLLERLNSALAGADRAPCERIPLAEYARIGWGLRVADTGAPVVETVSVVRDYQPRADELALPRDARDITQAVLGGGQ